MASSDIKLWRVTLRRMGIVRSECEPFTVLVTNHFMTEKETVNQLRREKFSPEWWDENLITEVQYIGNLWFDGVRGGFDAR